MRLSFGSHYWPDSDLEFYATELPQTIEFSSQQSGQSLVITATLEHFANEIQICEIEIYGKDHPPFGTPRNVFHEFLKGQHSRLFYFQVICIDIF
jgi:hypothetical protein